MIQFDHPFLLLAENPGEDKQITKGGLFAQMVKKTGEENSKLIFEAAKNAYDERF